MATHLNRAYRATLDNDALDMGAALPPPETAAATGNTPKTARHTGPPPPPDSVLLTVRQLAEQQPALSEGGIRWTIFHSDANGLANSGALVRAGRRVMLDPALYMAWLRTNPTISPPRPKAGKKVTPRAGRLPTPPRAAPVLDHEAA